jgi:glycosyltransferase involved in cell wall biosynthesis
MMEKHGFFKVTVGMCVKNAEEIIKDAISSVINQVVPKGVMELVIVDGSSKDRTLQILKNNLRGVDLSYRLFSENKGLGHARQMVVENALGEYIVWVDADMIVPEDYVRNQVAFMEEHPSVGIAGGKYGLHSGEGLAADLENIVYCVDSMYGEKSSSKYGYLPGVEGSIVRVKAMRAVGGFDSRMNGAAEDTELVYRLRDSGWEIAVTKETFTESTRQSWVSLWKQYVWYGQGGHYVFHKNRNAINLWKMTPVAGFLAGCLRCPGAYLLLHRFSMFLLPFHYTYKRTAWLFGFLGAHFGGYGHFSKK